MNDIPDKFKTGYISAKSGNIITPIFRADWVFLLKPTKDRIEEGITKPGYYSIDMVFPAYADFTILKKAMQEKLTEKFGSKMQSPEFVAKLRIPLKDQAEKLDKDGNMRPGYVKGQKVITSTAKKEYKPGLVDMNGNDIVEPKDFFTGVWAIASLSPFAFDNKTKGVSLGLRHVQLVRADEVRRLRQPRHERVRAQGGARERPPAEHGHPHLPERLAVLDLDARLVPQAAALHARLPALQALLTA